MSRLERSPSISTPRKPDPGRSFASRPRKAALSSALGSRRRLELLVLVAGALFAVAFYAVNVVHYVGQPLRIEESEWPPMGKAIVENGKPVIYEGQDHRLRLDHDFTPMGGDHNGLWHPPLYMHAMAATMLVAGTDAAESLRLIGALGLLVTCGLLLLIARELAPRRWPVVGLAAVILLLLHPYAIQGSLFLDIDTSIYPTTFVMFVLAALRLERAGTRSRWWALAVVAAAFALVLWTKLPTAFVLVPVGTLYWLLRLGVVRGLVAAAGAFLGGAALFLATYAAYVAATGQSFWFTFEFTLVEKGTTRFFWQAAPGSVKSAVDWHVAWFLPALLAVVGLYGLVAARRWVRVQRVEPLDFIWALGVSILIAYAVLTPNGTVYQGKYALPALPLLVLVATVFLLGPEVRLPSLAGAGLAAAVGVATAAFMPDLLTDQHYSVLRSYLKLAVLVGSAAALAIAALATRRRGALGAGALIVLVVLFAAQSMRSYRADVSPMYPMTDTQAFEAAVDAVNSRLKPGEIALVPKDLGYYVDGTVIEGEEIWLTKGDPFEAQALRELDQIQVVATNSFGPPLGGESLLALQQCFTQQSFGRAFVYLRKPNCDA